MADILGRYLQGEAAEENRLDKEEQMRSHRLNQTKLMMDMIRANAPLRPEDARDLARVHELEPHETERLYSSIYANTPTLFPQVHQTINQAMQAKFASEERLNLRDYINTLKMDAQQNARDLQTPSQEEYEANYAPLYRQFDMEPPPYARLTHSENMRNIQLAQGAYNAKTQRGKSTTPTPNTLDQPIDPKIVADAANEYGVPVPEHVNTHREYNEWLKPKTKPKAEPGLTEDQKIGSNVNDVTDYLMSVGQPKSKLDDKNRMIVEPQIEALFTEISSRAIQQGGGNANAVARKMLTDAGWKPGMKGKDAQKILDSLGEPPKPQKTAAEKDRDIRKALRGDRY